MDDIPDYTIEDEPTVPHRFKVHGEVFEAVSVLYKPARQLWQRKIVPMFDDAGNLVDPSGFDLAEAFGEFLDLVLLPESAERFAAKMRDPLRPLSDDQAAAVVLGLISHYSGHPTPPLSLLNDGQPTESGNSMDGAPHEELIPTTSRTAVG